MNGDWGTHYNKLKEKKFPPSATLLKALALFKSENLSTKYAIDLGCGTGIDTMELLEKGWKVTAIDNQMEALNQLQQHMYPFFDQDLKVIHNSFEFINLPAAHLINASFSLPFCHPDHFEDLWKNIENAITVGGRFAGHFFGTNDSWVTNDKMTFLNEKQVCHLFDSFSVEWMEESERDGKTIGGKEKHWHVFHVVAKKLNKSLD